MSAPGIFTTDWVDAYARALRDDDPFRRLSRWFDGCVRLRSGETWAWFLVRHGDVVDTGIGRPPPSLVTLEGNEEAWRELFSPGASLNRSVRRGRITLGGDRVAVMHWWKMVYVMTEVGGVVSAERADDGEGTGGAPCPT